MYRGSVSIVTLIFLLSFNVSTQGLAHAQMPEDDQDLRWGPSIDLLQMKVITQNDQQVLALQDDEVDAIIDMIDPSYIETLSESDNIQISSFLNNGWGGVLFHADKYPLNITAFRRAFAQGIDKYQVCRDFWNGDAIPIDSFVPRGDVFSIEDSFPVSYYNGNITQANITLEDAGFLDIDNDGFREAPDGSEINLLMPLTFSGMADFVIDTFTQMGVNVTMDDWYIYESPTFERFQAQITGITGFNLRYIQHTLNNFYWSFDYQDQIEEIYIASNFEEVYSACSTLQENILNDCVVVPVYQRILHDAYRIDQFRNHVNGTFSGVYTFLTSQKIRLLDQIGGPYGGTFRWASPYPFEDCNFLTSDFLQSIEFLKQHIWDTLLKVGPDGNLFLWRAENYQVQVYEDNPSVGIGNMKIIFELVPDRLDLTNRSITAHDVVASINLYRSKPDLSIHSLVQNITSVLAPTDYRLEITYNTSSYWNLIDLCNIPILSNTTALMLTEGDVSEWNPSQNENELFTGPFAIERYEEDVMIELVYRNGWPFVLGIETPHPWTHDDTVDLSTTFLYAIMIAALPLVLFIIALIIQSRRRLE